MHVYFAPEALKVPYDCCIILKSGSYTIAPYVLIGLLRSNREHSLTFRRAENAPMQITSHLLCDVIQSK